MDQEKKAFIYRVKAQEGFLGEIKYEDVVSWLSNFNDEFPVGYFLMDNLIVITRDQIKSCVKSLLGKIQSMIYYQYSGLSDEELFDCYNEHLGSSAFICPARNNDHASSANMIGRVFRGEIGENLYHEYTFPQICRGIEAGTIKNIYIVDDFIGTGKQVTDYIEGKRGAGQKENCIQTGEDVICTIRCIYEKFTEIPINILVIVANEKGVRNISDIYPRIRILSSYYLNESYNMLNERCKLYLDKGYKQELINYIISECRKKNEEINISNKYGLGLSICMVDRFPNNSLELFWWDKSKDWKPLLDIR